MPQGTAGSNPALSAKNCYSYHVSLLDILFPKRCVRCKRVGEYICADCFARISFDTKLICLVCGKRSIDGLTHPGCLGKYTIDGAFCGVAYKDIVRKLLYQLKYQPYLTDLQASLTDLLYESLIQQSAFMHALETRPVVVPIPLSQKRLRQRGYNQAILFAKGLSTKFKLEIVDVLERRKETRPQYGLSKEDRAENMKDAFGIRANIKTPNVAGKTAFLIDDILTTGSTLYEAAKVLKKNGFEKVWGIAFAKD